MAGFYLENPLPWPLLDDASRTLGAEVRARGPEAHITLALPCMGLDGATRALQEMQVPSRLAWGCDIDKKLEPALRLTSRAGEGGRATCGGRSWRSASMHGGEFAAWTYSTAVAGPDAPPPPLLDSALSRDGPQGGLPPLVGTRGSVWVRGFCRGVAGCMSRGGQGASASKRARRLHGEDWGEIYTGPGAGDIMTISAGEMPAAQILVCGPPCGQWSKPGRRLPGGSATFEKVVDLICHDSNLQAFILEAPLGIWRVVNGQDAYLGDLLKRFSVEAPDFQLYVYDIDACTHGGLPQSRPRVYVVGVRRSALEASPHAMPDRISALETELLQVDPRLKEFLDFRLENNPPEAVKQRLNHTLYVQRWEGSHEGVGGQHLLCCDVNRSPAAPFGGASRCDGKSLTITPGNRALWMVSSGYARNINRRLNLREHARLQGMFVETLCGMKPSAMRVAIGAATPPSCLGRVLAHLVRVVLRLPIPANRVRWPLPQPPRPPQPAQPLAEPEETEGGDPAPPARRRASILELLQAQKRARVV